ncbi:MAG: DNA mismatch repair endonuclease MutL [Bacteroidales bacterium]|nr:DNA mismatch repair endonuclease MutL [Bacteroidales bacterium]
MDLINILPDSVANQIAAGEVVDRPASAVKELLENALDAGATKIQLIVKDAGRTLIQVIDNGCGMSDSDARVCFERHATSKIHKADDLFAIHTMGFRGEALASIAAIAQVELKTKMHENELGTQVIIEGSEIKEQSTCSCPNGTSIAVKNLFFNVPARRNFLKKDTIELSHIEEIFKRVALVNYGIDYSFYSNGKLLYDLHAGNFAERISQLYGTSYRERLCPIDEKSDIVSVHGYVSKPEYARKSRGEQYLFVNNRFIKHPALSAAVEKAYSDVIPDRYYPSYFLHLEVDPSRMDVNIHPTKTEVKFIDEHALFAILRAATKKALGQFSLANEIQFNPIEEVDFPPAPKGYIPSSPKVHYDPDYNPFANSTTKSNTSLGGYHTPNTEVNKFNSSKWTSFFDATDKEDARATHPSSDAPADPTPNPQQSTNIGLPQREETAQPLSASPCMQIQGRYIVSALPSGLLLVDQQAAHERVLFEKLTSSRQTIASQQLLFPVNCQFSPADAEVFVEILPDLKEHGFEIGTLGQTTFVVTATPPDINEGELQQLFDQIIVEYKGSMIQKFNDSRVTLCRSLAKQMAVKAGTLLQQAEMQQLIADLFCCQVPSASPSGKKTMVVLDPHTLLV